jgi:hypothetical protein
MAAWIDKPDTVIFWDRDKGLARAMHQELPSARKVPSSKYTNGPIFAATSRRLHVCTWEAFLAPTLLNLFNSANFFGQNGAVLLLFQVNCFLHIVRNMRSAAHVPALGANVWRLWKIRDATTEAEFVDEMEALRKENPRERYNAVNEV